jgi:TonB family protein
MGPPMRAQFLTLATAIALAAVALPAAAQSGAQSSGTVSPVTVSPQTKPPPADAKINVGGDDPDLQLMLNIWPKGAFKTYKAGHVTLRCNIDAHGLAESCDVASESPQGQGFGRAALKMRHTFRLPPTPGSDGPASTVKNVQITFNPCDSGDPDCENPGLTLATEITDPVWTQAPSFNDLAAAYPAGADGAEHYAAARCAVGRGGALEGCGVIKEDAGDKGFGLIAVHLAQTKFKVDPSLQSRPGHLTLVDVPVRFPSRQELAERTVMAPAWLTSLDPKATPRLFPPEAVAQGLTTGRGVARCTVGADGTLSACAPEPGEPDGLGFSEAAAKLAGGMKMNLWSNDDAPVQGGVVHIPVRLNLKGGVQ